MLTTTTLQFPKVPAPPKPASNEFKPALGAARIDPLREGTTPVVGTRYCQHIHAYVPENLPFEMGKIAAAPAPKAPLRERMQFWQRASDDDKENSARPEIRVVPSADGTTVLAAGLTYHQAGLVSLKEAQQNVGIKYRSMTTKRTDLVPHVQAWRDAEVVFRTVSDSESDDEWVTVGTAL